VSMEEQRQRMEDEARRTQAESAQETPAATDTGTTGNSPELTTFQIINSHFFMLTKSVKYIFESSHKINL